MQPDPVHACHAARVRSIVGAAACLGVAMIVPACQSYAPRPISESEARERFLARAASAESLEAFRASLEGGAPPDGGVDAASASGLPATLDARDGLSLGEAELVATVFNPAVRRARLAAAVASAGAANAGLLDDPSIGVDLTRLLEGGGDAWEALGSVSFSVPLSDRLALDEALARGELASELARVVGATFDARLAVRRAWVECATVEAQGRSLDLFIGRLDEVLELVDLLESRGEISRVEARIFRVEEASARAQAVRVAADLVRAGRSLRRAMGLPPDAPLDIAPTFAASEFGEEFREIAAWRSPPSLGVLEANLVAAERALELEVERQYPDLVVGPGYGTQDGDRQFVLGLGLRLPIFNANRRAIAEAEASRELARVSFATAVEALEADRADALTDRQAAAAQRALVEQAVLPLVEAQDADVRRLFTLGAEIDALVLLDGVSRQNDARLSLVAARRAEALATIRLMELGWQAQGPAADGLSRTEPGQPAQDASREHAAKMPERMSMQPAAPTPDRSATNTEPNT